MTLAAAVLALALFAFACGLAVGVGVTQGWYERPADEDRLP